MRPKKWGASPEEWFMQNHKVDSASGCWIWQGHLNPYGKMLVKSKRIPAHVFSYELLVGPIPDGLVLDHLCRNPSCVNPRHVEPVTQRENIIRSPIAVATGNIRKSHCVNGHPLIEGNLYINPQGHRICLQCRRRVDSERYARNTEARKKASRERKQRIRELRWEPRH